MSYVNDTLQQRVWSTFVLSFEHPSFCGFQLQLLRYLYVALFVVPTASGVFVATPTMCGLVPNTTSAIMFPALFSSPLSAMSNPALQAVVQPQHVEPMSFTHLSTVGPFFPFAYDAKSERFLRV